MARSQRYTLFKLLRALRGLYSFRELEKLLATPYQVLWRYTTLTSIPEEKSIAKLFSRAAELRLLDRAANTIAEALLRSPAETLCSPALLELLGLCVRELVGDALCIIALSDDAACAAAAIGLELGAPAWTPSLLARLDPRRALVSWWRGRDGVTKTLVIPRACLRERGRLVLVATPFTDPGIAGPIDALLHRLGMHALLIAIGPLQSSLPRAKRISTVSFPHPLLPRALRLGAGAPGAKHRVEEHGVSYPRYADAPRGERNGVEGQEGQEG